MNINKHLECPNISKKTCLNILKTENHKTYLFQKSKANKNKMTKQIKHL